MANSITNTGSALTVYGRVLLRALSSRLAMLQRVTTSYDTPVQYGSTVQIPDLDVVGAAATRAVGGAATASNLVTGVRSITLQQIYSAIQVENMDVFFSSVDLMSGAANRTAYRVAEKVDSILCALWSKIGNEVGPLDGSAAFSSLAYISNAKRELSKSQSPLDDLHIVLNPTEADNFRQVSNLYKVNEAGSPAGLHEGNLSRVFGFEICESQQIASATTTQADISWTVTGVNAQGATTLVTGAQGSGTVAKGTTFKIAGFTNSAGYDVRFVVTADATISGNAATLSIYPPLPSATAGAEVITAISHSASSSQNLAFHRDAIVALAFPPAPFPMGSGVVSEVVRDEQTGLGVRVGMASHLLGSGGTAYTTELSADIVFGAEVVRPQYACRITGAP